MKNLKFRAFHERSPRCDGCRQARDSINMLKMLARDQYANKFSVENICYRGYVRKCVFEVVGDPDPFFMNL